MTASEGEAPTAATDQELERFRRALEASGRYHVLERYQEVGGYGTPAPGTELLQGLYVDVETTGFDSQRDAIIEFGYVAFEFDRDGNLYRIRDRDAHYEDPGRPIPETITRITGIRDEDVRGTRIPDDKVNALVDGSSLIIAHNADFDRGFLERRLPAFEARHWACSANDIAWREEGFEGRKLEYLCMKAGFVYDGHRAVSDCLAGVELLSRTLPRSGVTGFAALQRHARLTQVRLWAVDSPFASKDLLKRRGYRWLDKCWYTDLEQTKLEAEVAWLREAVYTRHVDLPYLPITALLRYSKRIPGAPPKDAAVL